MNIMPIKSCPKNRSLVTKKNVCTFDQYLIYNDMTTVSLIFSIHNEIISVIINILIKNEVKFFVEDFIFYYYFL